VAHDAAGNMTFDGQHEFTYDAWNRLVKVHRAYRDHEQAATAGVLFLLVRMEGIW